MDTSIHPYSPGANPVNTSNDSGFVEKNRSGMMVGGRAVAASTTTIHIPKKKQPEANSFANHTISVFYNVLEKPDFKKLSANNLVEALLELGLKGMQTPGIEGGTSKVYEYQKDQSPVMVKVMRNPIKIIKEGSRYGDICLLNLQSCPNIVKAEGVILQHEKDKTFAFLSVSCKESIEHESDYRLVALVMKKAVGAELTELIYDNKIGTELALLILEKICEAMVYLQNNDFVYRDLKPENIIFDTTSKKLHIVDFGFAKQLKNVHGMKRTNSFVGTSAFFAPDVIFCKKIPYGERVDNFGIGAMAMCLLSGFTPGSLKSDRSGFDDDYQLSDQEKTRRSCLFSLLKNKDKRQLILQNLSPDIDRNDQRTKVLAQLACDLLEFFPYNRPSLVEVSNRLAAIKGEVSFNSQDKSSGQENS